MADPWRYNKLDSSYYLQHIIQTPILSCYDISVGKESVKFKVESTVENVTIEGGLRKGPVW